MCSLQFALFGTNACHIIHGSCFVLFVAAVPMLNYHLGAIVARQFWLAIGADLVMIGAFAGFFGYQHFNKDDSDWA